MTDIKNLKKEIRKEQLLKLAIKHRKGLFAVIVAILAVSIIFSFVSYTQNTKLERASKKYLESYNLSQTLPFNLADIKDESQKNTLSKVKDILLGLSNSNAGIFTDLASLELADIYFKQGENKLALEKLNFTIKNSSTSSLKNLAKIKLASFYINSNENLEDAKKILVTLKKESEFASISSELLLSIYLKQNNNEQAQKLIQELLANENIGQSTKTRLKKILQNI